MEIEGGRGMNENQIKVGDNLLRTIIIECYSGFEDDREFARIIGEELGALVQIENIKISKPRYELRFEKKEAE